MSHPEINPHTDPIGYLQSQRRAADFNRDARAGSGSTIGMGQQIMGASALAQAASTQLQAQRDQSPVEGELQQLQANIKHLFCELDGLGKQLQPVLVPQLKGEAGAQGEQTGVATSPLHRSIYAANVQLTKLVQQVAMFRSSLSI